MPNQDENLPLSYSVCRFPQSLGLFLSNFCQDTKTALKGVCEVQNDSGVRRLPAPAFCRRRLWALPRAREGQGRREKRLMGGGRDADPAAKLAEYQEKLRLWSVFFLEDNGRPPSEAEMHADAHWLAIKHKCDKYSAQSRGDGSPRHHRKERRHGHRHHRSRSSDARRGSVSGSGGGGRGERGRSVALTDLGDPSEEGLSLDERMSRQGFSFHNEQNGDSAHGRRGRRGSNGSSRTASTNTRTASTLSTASLPARLDSLTPQQQQRAAEQGSPRSPPDSLPAIPRVFGQLASSPDWVATEQRARSTLEKLNKWEAAFRREQGVPPTYEQKDASHTYTSSLSKYLSSLRQLDTMVSPQHTQRALAAHATCTRCTRNVHSLHTQCALAAYAMCTRCTRNVYSLHTQCALAAYAMCTRNVHSPTLTLHSSHTHAHPRPPTPTHATPTPHPRHTHALLAPYAECR